jgi:hypothetical protein
MTWRKLQTRELHGSYGKRDLLQTIYAVYIGWRDEGATDRIRRQLASRLPGEAIDPSEHLLGLLIKVALPEVQANVVAIWVGAILYGEAHHVRPHKLRSFFHVKGGLVRCARLHREDQQKKRVEEEIAVADEQDWKEREQEAGRARRRARWTMPDGMRLLY